MHARASTTGHGVHVHILQCIITVHVCVCALIVKSMTFVMISHDHYNYA